MAIQAAIEELQQVERQITAEIEEIDKKILGLHEEVGRLAEQVSQKTALRNDVAQAIESLGRLKSLLPEVVVAIKEPQQEEVGVPNAPAPKAGLQSETKWWGVFPRARRILRTAFSIKGKPTFMEALQRTYGDNWEEERLSSTVSKTGVRTDLLLGDEKGRQFLLDSIINTVVKLEYLREESGIPAGAVPTKALRNLYGELDWEKRGTEIHEVVGTWSAQAVEREEIPQTANEGKAETTQAETSKAAKTKKWGLNPIAGKIIRKSFRNGQTPDSLVEALEYTYGDSLPTQIIMVPTGGGKTTMQKVSLLEAAKNSQVVHKILGYTLKRLIQVKDGTTPDGVVIHKPLMSLFMDVQFRTRSEEIVSTMKQWGVNPN